MKYGGWKVARGVQRGMHDDTLTLHTKSTSDSRFEAKHQLDGPSLLQPYLSCTVFATFLCRQALEPLSMSGCTAHQIAQTLRCPVHTEQVPIDVPKIALPDRHEP